MEHPPDALPSHPHQSTVAQQPSAPRAAALRFPSALCFSASAWLQLQFLCHAGGTEIGAFGISHPENPFYIIGLGLIRQCCTAVTVAFDDGAVADFFDEQIDQGRSPEHFARIWIHTHPGDSAEPSGVDERTFEESFGRCDWAIMFILAKGGDTTCRLRLAANAGGARLAVDRMLKVRVDWESLDTCPGLALVEDWWEQYDSLVEEQPDFWTYQATAASSRKRPPQGQDEQTMLDWFDSLDPDEQQALLDSTRGDWAGMEFDSADDMNPRSHSAKEVFHAE
jgi:hypothetical protein